jgi:hypothetical protein
MQFLFPSSYPGRLASQNSALLSAALCCWTFVWSHFTRTAQKTDSAVEEVCLLMSWLAVDIQLLLVCFRENVFTESLPSNGYTRHDIFAVTGVHVGWALLLLRQLPEIFLFTIACRQVWNRVCVLYTGTRGFLPSY